MRSILVIWCMLLGSLPGAALAEAGRGEGLTLTDALTSAREHLEDFDMVDEELERARAARDRAWAALLPSLSASGTFTYSDREVAFNDRVLQRQETLAASVSASLAVIRADAIADTVRAHRATGATDHAVRWSRNELSYEVARAFFAALSSETLVRAAERSRATAGEYLDAVRARRAAGAAVGVDEERARLEVIAADESLLRARNTLAGAQDYLGFLIGVEPPLTLARPEIRAEGESPESAVGDEAAPPARADRRAAAAEVSAARVGVTQAWLDYLPTVTLTGLYRVSQNTGWSGDPDSWQLLLTLDWVIFDGGLRRATRRERASILRSSQLNQSRLEREALRELRQARRDLSTALATLGTATERLALARETRAMVLRQYRAGVINSLELTDADDTLRQAEVGLVARELELALTWLSLNRALGLDPLGEVAE